MFTYDSGYEKAKATSQEELEACIPLTGEEYQPNLESLTIHNSQRFSIKQIWLWISLALNAVFLAAVIWQYHQHRVHQSPFPPYPDLVYSPAQHLIEYEQVDFVDGLRFLDGKPRSVYLGPPTEEGDAAWDELYDIGGISQIPASEAAKLSEPTAKVLDEPGSYFVGLDVFHQLHCLNWVRKALRPERYGLGMEDFTKEQREEHFLHTDHCIDSIRQSLMCSADISPVIWHWKKDGFKQDMNNTHVCRNFDKITDWAKDHMLEREINSKLPEGQASEIIAAAVNSG